MRRNRYAWLLVPLFSLAGFALIGASSQCADIGPGVSIGPRPSVCDVDFLGMHLSQNAAGWLAALVGAALGVALAAVIYHRENRRAAFSGDDDRKIDPAQT